MVEAAGPTRLLEVCGQLLSRFLRDAERKRLAWLREAEEQGMRMLESNLGAEPGPMARTPSQRRRSRKRQSCCLKDYGKEPSRRRLSRRRSSIKLVSSKPGSQRRQSKEQPLDPDCGGEGAQACAAAALPALTGEGAAEVPGPSRTQAGYPQHCPAGAWELPIWEQSPQGDAASEWQDEAPGSGVRAGSTARGAQAAPGRRTSTSTPKAAGAGAAPDLGELLLPGSGSQAAALGPGARRCCRRRSSLSAAGRGASLSKRRSLASRRASRSRRASGRAVARRAAARESSSASSRVSCQSSLEVFVEEDVAGMRPGLELDPPSEGAPEDTLPSSKSTRAASSPAQHSCAPEQQAGNDGGTPVNPNSESQNKDQERSTCARPQEDPPCIWTRSHKQAMGAVRKGQQPGAQAPSPLADQHGSPAEPSGAGSKVSGCHGPSAPAPARSSPPASPFRWPGRCGASCGQCSGTRCPSPGPPRHGGVVRSILQRSTPTRPNPKGDFVEKERQRLESLRKKQEAEEQRKKKMEEEKRRRQAEMKQKREERLRKALQARERAEEEKKKRMEQKILQSDEKVRLSQVRDREEKAEERGRKKLSKKSGEADARKQKALKGEEDELEQQELLQKRREDEVKGNGRKVLELRSLLEQQQAEHGKERNHRHGGKEKPPHPQLGAAAFPEKHRKRGKYNKTDDKPNMLLQGAGAGARATSSGGEAGVALLPGELPSPITSCWVCDIQTPGGAIKGTEELRILLQGLRNDGSVPEPAWLFAWEEAGLQHPGEKKLKQPGAPTAAPGTGLSKTLKKSISAPYLKPLKGTKQSSRPKVSEDNYGMDQNSDDATDDENDPRKPVPAWADGPRLRQGIVHQYYHPVNTDQLFGLISGLRLEEIFGKSKPRYFKRTSSAVWHSPPRPRSASGPSCSLNK
ncbi:LOW QUALITY PROTEIN: uncharacterized protein ACIB01_007049 [Guaruba guarouba]